MTDLYFECNNGISGDMSVAALIDAGADVKKLEKALDSMKLEKEFEYKITKTQINSISATDFDVITHNSGHHHESHEHSFEHHHSHEHRNLEDVIKIINSAQMSDEAKKLAKKIFTIIAEAEAKVHEKDINLVHFHETGAIDSIADIVSFSVLYDDLNPRNVYFSVLGEGTGTVMCQHGELNVPVPAVCEIVSKYKIPIKMTENNGEMITPTGAAIVAALYNEKNNKLPGEIIIEKIGTGAGKRKYKNPVLRVMLIKNA